MKNFLTLKNFFFLRRIEWDLYEKVDPTSNFESAKLVLDVIKTLENETDEFPLTVVQGTKFCNPTPYPEYYFLDQITVFNKNLSHQLANQINSIINQVNNAASDTQQANTSLNKTLNSGSMSPINEFINDLHNYSPKSLFSPEVVQDYKFIPYKKYSFCDTPRAMTSDPYEFLFRTIFFSVCSWKISETTPLLDEKNFHITIIFTVYDHWQDKYFEMKLNVTTPSWIEEESKKQPLTFFKYILIQEYFDLEIIKHHIYRTLIYIKTREQLRYYVSSVYELGHGFELSPEYEEIAADY